MNVGLALSGGGIRGIAHAGVIKALEEKNIEITHIGGTSAGSVIAALYAIGYGPDNMYTLFKRYGKMFTNLDHITISKEIKNFLLRKKIKTSGFNAGENFEDLYNNLAFPKGIKKLTDVRMPIVMPTVDINTSTKYILSSIENKSKNWITDISLGEAVRASSSFPGVYKPFKYKGHLFVDGGLLENIPVNEIKLLGAEKVIAVKFSNNAKQDKSNAIDIAIKALDIMGDEISKNDLDGSDYVITIPVDGVGILDLGKIEYCFNKGYEITKEFLEENGI